MELAITEKDGRKVTSARHLHQILEVGTDFTEWCKRMFDYGFIEDIDFTPILGKSTGGRPSKDYALTVECAKEISMLQRTERGKMVRMYFIEKEKQANEMQQPKPLSQIDIIIQSAMQIKEQEQRISQVEDKVLLLEAKQATRPDYFTVIGFAIMNHLSIGLQMAARIGAKAKAICKANDITVETIPDPRFGKVGMYPRNILQDVFDSLEFK